MVGHGNERLAMQRRIADLESALQSAWQESATLKAALAESERTLRLVRSDLREAFAVPCSDHAHGLRGSLVDGHEGCPWCRVAESERARHRAEDCGQDGVCAIAPGCQRHWADHNRELVAERDAYRAALAELAGALPKCVASPCRAGVPMPATRYGMHSGVATWCDRHPGPDGLTNDAVEYAAPLRAALALLAKANDEGGK